MALGGWAEEEKKLSLFPGHQLECCQGDRVSHWRVCVPFCPAVTSCLGWELGAWGPEGPKMAVVKGCTFGALETISISDTKAIFLWTGRSKKIHCVANIWDWLGNSAFLLRLAML